MAEQEIVIRDDSGTEHVFPAGFDPQKAIAIVRQSSAAPAMQRLGTVSKDEPGTFLGGFVKSLKDQAGEAFSGAAPMLESIAHPHSAGDFAGLLMPATALGTGASSLRGWAGAAKNLAAGASEGMADREGLKKLPAMFRGMKNVAFDTASGGDRAFQKMPLAQQMESLTEARPNPLPRPPVPPLQAAETPFHERPLWQQMQELGEGPSPQRGNTGPPIRNLGTETAATTGLSADVDAARAAASGSNPLSPEAKAKLLKQLQMSRLVKIGPETQ